MRRQFFALFLIFLFGSILLVSVESCKHNPSYILLPADTTHNGGGKDTTIIDTTHWLPKHICSPDSVYFENDILPLITSHCSMPGNGCHDGSGGELTPLVDYPSISRNVNRNKPSSSRIYTVLSGRGEDKMPRSPGVPLTGAQDSLLLAWIEQGALDNKCDGACDTTGITYSQSVARILVTSCIGCHNSSLASGNAILTDYSDVLKQVNNGNLIGTITHAPSYHPMPQSSSLSDCDINTIKIWIRSGSPNN